jgi:hypothetical protein
VYGIEAVCPIPHQCTLKCCVDALQHPALIHIVRNILNGNSLIFTLICSFSIFSFPSIGVYMFCPQLSLLLRSISPKQRVCCLYETLSNPSEFTSSLLGALGVHFHLTTTSQNFTSSSSTFFKHHPLAFTSRRCPQWALPRHRSILLIAIRIQEMKRLLIRIVALNHPPPIQVSPTLILLLRFCREASSYAYNDRISSFS